MSPDEGFPTFDASYSLEPSRTVGDDLGHKLRYRVLRIADELRIQEMSLDPLPQIIDLTPDPYEIIPRIFPPRVRSDGDDDLRDDIYNI